MNTYGYCLAGLATFVFTASFGTGGEVPSSAAASLLAPRQELVAEIAASIRDSLRTVTPEIALPGIEFETPAVAKP
jgi:predicted cobalt transporter CbtA